VPASIDDVLTAIKNIVTALNTQVQTSINIEGAQDFYNVASATMVKTGAGRIGNVMVIVAGSASGTVYDAANVSDTSRPIYTISNAATGRFVVGMPFQYGLLIVPGTGQTVAGSYS